MRLWHSIFALCAAFGLAPGVASAADGPAAVGLSSANDPTSATMRFLEDRVRRDPEDAGANARLAAIYLQRMRETGSIEYLDLAQRAARASLASVPAIRNAGGLAVLVKAEFASHEFATARDHALELAKLDSGQGYVYSMLGDALLELGDYDAADNAFNEMDRIQAHLTIDSETRHARVALLHGDIPGAQRRLSIALALVRNLPVPPRESIAWCQWQLGNTAFSAGDYETAERYERDALVTFPDYVYALASLGRVRAARSDVLGAIEQYEHAVGRLPDPTLIAELGDLYKLAGRDRKAAAQYLLVEQIGRLSAAAGALYNRQLALFYADHDLKSDEAYASATREYSVRRDIYGADAVAWAALKAHKIDEAQVAIKEALRLGTQDAKLFYHAGMIARAAGDDTAARGQFKRALALNPQFDPLQVSILVANFGE